MRFFLPGIGPSFSASRTHCPRAPGGNGSALARPHPECGVQRWDPCVRGADVPESPGKGLEAEAERAGAVQPR